MTTIITGLQPDKHGLVLDNGVTCKNPLIIAANTVTNYFFDGLQTRLGGWLLTNTDADAFRTPAIYYVDNGIETMFDDHETTAIGIPNYVVDPDTENREHHFVVVWAISLSGMPTRKAVIGRPTLLPSTSSA
jgi:predicted AlkP superfamily pyrophosphatase or phosphodiesterase